MAEKLTDFMNKVEQSEPQPFTSPQIYYGSKEDSLTLYFRPDESYAHRLNNLVTIFLTHEGDELVGCQIKGLCRKLKTDGNFTVAITRNKELELGLFFYVLAYEAPDQEPKNRLLELGDLAKGVKLDTKEMALSGC
jgi:hypothetical protein